MKILLAHNFYRSSAPSGEDAVFRNERKLLERHVDVVSFEKFNDEIDISSFGKKVKVALDGGWSHSTYDELSRLVRDTRPDLAHFHSIFPQISPSAYAACRDNGVPVVHTLHNFRFICPGALLMRDGEPCEDCVGTSLLPALRHRCYRGSFAATAAQVWAVQSNRWRGTFQHGVDRYVALTQFAASRLIAGGLPQDRVGVKANFLPDPPPPGAGQGGYVVYVGRLTPEKGVSTLIEAWAQVGGVPLKIVGDGELRAGLEAQAAASGAAIEFLGFRPTAEVLDLLGNASAMVLPSRCYEGFPMAVLESYASGTPVLASRIGSLNEIVEEGVTGMKFVPGDASDLARTALALLADRERLAAMRRNCRAIFGEKFSAERNLSEILAIYHRAIEQFESEGKSR